MRSINDVKVLIDARMIHDSGIGVYIQQLLSGLNERGMRVDVITKEKDRSAIKDLYPAVQNCRVFDAGIYSLKELGFLSLQTRNTDVFWSPHYNVPLVNFASQLKIVTIHDVYHLAYYDTLSAKQKVYARQMLRHAVNNSDLVFTVSEFSKQEIVKYLSADPDKITVVYNGVDFDRFHSQVSVDLKKYKIQDPYILFVGNVKPHKNLKNALLGFRRYAEKAGTASGALKFVIVGKRDGFITGDVDVLQMLEEPFFRERVLFTGWVNDEDLPALYQQASLFVFPSYYEGFGFPPLEAMAAGCAVISSSAACMPEIYADAVHYFDPADENDIALAIEKVLADETYRDTLKQKGLSRVKMYRWEEAITKKLDAIGSKLNRLLP